ncbi:MAG: glycosyltransferase family 2 protein, partial [Anaerolineae bacterium]|nr:glycosyltransferase family 2 protein [Anaerolineae bacterium]
MCIRDSYEDTDLAWRARLRGWQVFYAPQAIVRHIHCGTSQEWSLSFIYYTDRNRLAMVWKNGTRRQMLWAVGKYIGRMLINIAKMVHTFLMRQDWWVWSRHVQNALRVLCTLIVWLPTLELKRHQIQRSRTVTHEALAAWFVG